nr:ABC-2 type transporter [uncultured bacterium]
MKLLREIYLFYARKIKESSRNPAFLVMGISTPILYLTLFAPLLKNFAVSMGAPSEGIYDMFVPGMLVMNAFFGGFFSGFGVIDELRGGVIERFRVTPTSRFSILAGPVFHDLTAVIVLSVLFIGLAVPFGFHIHVTGLLSLFVLLALLLVTSSSFSHALGLITKSEDSLAPIVHGINLPIMLLSGMLLPIDFAPNWMKIVAHFNPVYYVVEAGRALAVGDFAKPIVTQAFCVMIPVAALTMTWATRIYRKAVM